MKIILKKTVLDLRTAKKNGKTGKINVLLMRIYFFMKKKRNHKFN